MDDDDALFQKKLQEYQREYDIAGLNATNDLAALQMLIRYEILIQKLQQKMRELADTDVLENAQELKKMSDLLRDTVNSFTQLQRDLGIDRRARKSTEDYSVARYIDDLLNEAQSFYEEQITRVFCPSCKTMVGRYAPVSSHTGYRIAFYCDTCKTWVEQQREPGDRFDDFDPADRAWRKKHPASIRLPEQPS